MAAKFPTTAHTNAVNALSDLVNRSITAGYTPASTLDGEGITYSILANLLTGVPPTLITAYSAACDPASLLTLTSNDTDVTMTGILSTDLIVGYQTSANLTSGIVIGGLRVKAADTITIRHGNITAGTIDQASYTLTVFVIHALA